MVHPRPLPWNAIISAFNESLTNKLPVVPYAEWLVKLENAAVRPTEDDLDAIVSGFPICLLLTMTLKRHYVARHRPSALVP